MLLSSLTLVRALLMLGLVFVLLPAGRSRISPVAPVHAFGASVSLPPGALLFSSNRTRNFEIFMMKSDGATPVQLTNDAAYDSFWPRPSPDRTKILFVRTPARVHDTDYTKATTWVMNADGTGLTRILSLGVYDWTIQAHPEWSPDGGKIAIVGGVSSNAQVFIVNSDGTNPVRVTSNGRGKPRGGTNTDPSWHPSGKYLLFVGCPISICLPSSYEVYRIKVDGTGETRLTKDNTPDYDPYYSPDTADLVGAGTIAWLRNTGSNRWAIFRMSPDGTDKRPVIDDGGINSKPGWSLDSSTIYFHRIPPGSRARTFFNIWKILPDGSGLTELILPRPTYVNEFPANGIN